MEGEGGGVHLHLIRWRLIVLPGCFNKDNDIVQVFFVGVGKRPSKSGVHSSLLVRDSPTERLPQFSNFPQKEHDVTNHHCSVSLGGASPLVSAIPCPPWTEWKVSQRHE